LNFGILKIEDRMQVTIDKVLEEFGPLLPAPYVFSFCIPIILKIPKLAFTFYLKKVLWWSLIGIVRLLRSSQVLVEGYFSCAEQGGGMSYVAEVLLDF